MKNFKISHKMFLGFGLIAILMLSVLGYSYINFKKEQVAIDWNIHTFGVIREAEAIERSLINMESGARGYAITGNEEFLEPFNQGKADYDLHYNNIKKLTEDNTMQQTRLVDLNKSYESWMEWETNELIIERQKVINGEATMEDLVQTVQSGVGKKEMDYIRTLIGEIIQEEQILLDTRSQNLDKMETLTGLVMSFGGGIASILAAIIALLFIRLVVTPVKAITKLFMEISQGDADLEFRLKVNSNDELGEMSKHFNVFMDKIKAITIENRNETWIKTGQTELNEKLRGDQDVKSLVTNVISYITKYVNAQVGTVYINTEQNILRLIASYAYLKRKNLSNEFKFGEGIIGQSALEKQTIIISNVPEDYITVNSGLGEAIPRNILVTPCIYHNDVKCVIEIASIHPFSDLQLEYIERISATIAMTIHNVESRIKTQELLDRTLAQAEELQVQQEELKQSNEELEVQTRALKESEYQLQIQQEELRQSNEELEGQAKALKESEARLQSQQEELRVINEELEERTKSLEIQRNDTFTKNENLRIAQKEIEDKAKALEIASKYKSEFLANMSHELRTPLNSILVLSQILSEKKEKHSLSDKQLEYARTIHSSGEDLLRLINDILDLSKVEAGKMDVVNEMIDVAELLQSVERAFKPIANQKGIEFKINIKKGTPTKILTDAQRVQQIINNLLSNAFKFTSKGNVTITLDRMVIDSASDGKANSYEALTIAVSDTGIGIPDDKHGIIFEAFKQSDGSTSRKYGGTGLGLSISKELIALLGGSIKLHSVRGEGSTFTLILPMNREFQNSQDQVAVTVEDIHDKKDNRSESKISYEQESKELEVKNDDRELMNSGTKDKLLLIIEDDPNFSQILYDLAHEKGYQGIIAEDGQTGLEMVKRYQPDAVLLDINLPDMNGWTIIDHLKKDSNTDKIPVHIISGSEVNNPSDLLDGIVGYLKKPVSLESMDAAFGKIESALSKKVKKLLIVDENEQQIKEITKLVSDKNIQIIALNKGSDAISMLKNERVDCMILELKLKDMSGFELLKKLKEENIYGLPVIIHTDKVLTQDDDIELRRFAESIIIKGSRSVERLLAETTLFLHDLDSKIEESKIKAIKSEREKESSFQNKKILIVDDDMRNVFALTSLLEEKGMKVVVGRNGKEGIQRLNQNSDINLILMDIMMPEMDGYLAMEEIRKIEKYRKIPMIALTAKAMKDDRQKCIEAGASDYLTKPLDIDKLTSLLRVWLYK